MRYLSHIIETKGVVHSLERSAQIVWRYSFGKRKFLSMTSQLEKDSGRLGVKLTFCVTTSILERHFELFRKITALGHCLAAHGHIHTDMKQKSRNEQLEMVRLCAKTFDAHGLEVKGFRCPYLSYDENTIEALDASPFAWISNNMVFWNARDMADGGAGARKLNRIYNTKSSENALTLPRSLKRLIDIPITAPDDEMIFERYRIKDRGSMTGYWMRILLKTYERGELFHLLFHPERFPAIKGPLVDLLEEARKFKPAVWFASLDEITQWWNDKSKSKWDFERSSSGVWRIWLHAPERITVLLKGDRRLRRDAGFYKGYSVIRPAASYRGLMAFNIGSARRYIIGIHPQAPETLEKFLLEEGFIVERSGLKANYSVYLGEFNSFEEEDKLMVLDRIDDSPHPVLRLWRWPNGARSAFTVSSDVDSISMSDFFRRARDF